MSIRWGRMVSAALITVGSIGVAGAIGVGTSTPAGAVTCPTITNGQVSPTPSPGVDWSGCNLVNADLQDADLANANLSDAILSDAYAYGADLASANLSGADLYGATLDEANLTDANATETNLTGTEALELQAPGVNFSGSDAPGDPSTATSVLFSGNLTGADFNGVDFSYASFDDADLTDASFDPYTVGTSTLYVDISGSQFQNANLSSASFEGASITGSTFYQANLSGADLSNCLFYQLGGSSPDSFTDATATQATFADDDLGNANFSSADLQYVASWSDTGNPTLPAQWELAYGYLIGPGADLISADLNGAQLSGVDLSGSFLSATTFEEADLSGADFEGCLLNATDFTDANLSGADLTNPYQLPFEGSDVSGTFNGANLAGANVSDDVIAATFDGATLTNINVGGTDLSQSDLTGVISGGIMTTAVALPSDWAQAGGYLVGPSANLTGANLNGVNLNSLDLEDANLTDATMLPDASMQGTNLAGANLGDATLTGLASRGIVGAPESLPTSWALVDGYLIGPSANLAGADLQSADLSSDSLANANLTGADLQSANMYNDSLVNAELKGADLQNADLQGANLSSADLTDANLEGASINGANFNGVTWNDTTCPDGTNSNEEGGLCPQVESEVTSLGAGQTVIAGSGALTAAATGGIAGTDTVTEEAYSSNPDSNSDFLTNGTNYFDVATSANSSFADVVIKDCVDVRSNTSLDWYTGAYYESVVADPTFPIINSGGCLSFTVDSNSTPNLSQLHGTVFANVQVPSVVCAVISGNVHSTVMFKKCVPFSKEDKTGSTSGLTLFDGGTITWSKSHLTTSYTGTLSPTSYNACPKKNSSEYDFSGEVTGGSSTYTLVGDPVTIRVCESANGAVSTLGPYESIDF